PPPPRAINRQIPDDVETIVLSCLAKEPHRRYQTVGELAAEIRRYLSGEPIDARRDNRWYVLRKTVARNKAVTALGATLLVLLIGFAVTMSLLYERAVTADRNTQREAATVQALNEFLLTMLESADPDHAPSRDVTLREVLRLASARIQADGTLGPEVASEIHRTIGRTFLQLGDYDDAETHLRASMDLRTRVFGEHSAMAAAGMRNFAEALIRQHKLDEAQRRLQTALSYYHAADGPRSDAQFNSGFAACLTSLGQVHHLRGELQEAETCFREALPLMPGGTVRQSDRASITLALASVLRDQGRLPESEVSFSDALESTRQVHGPHHPEVAAILNNLGQLYAQQEKLDRAEAAYRESLTIYRETLDPDHPRLATTLSNLGQLAGIRGDYATAENLFREALVIYRERLGPDHVHVATLTHNIASCKMNRHDYPGAIAEFQAALDIYHRTLGQDHPNNAIILQNLARAHEGNGDLSKAEDILREALTIQTRALPESHPDTANTLRMLGTVIMNHDSPVEAEPLLRRALDILRTTLPAGHSWIAIAEIRLGTCLTRLGRFEEARQLLEPGVQTLEETLGADDRRAIEARSALCDLYKASGQSDRLEACRAKLESHDQAQ
ncbi:MAG: tetratricopeptide repeat protein, partial [Planctomycetota bacterium]